MQRFFRTIGIIFGTLRAEYRQIVNRYFGTIERFDGDAQMICKQIVDRLWEGDFYRTSLGHFNFFWMRDFGTVAASLCALGHDARVRHTLNWALMQYMKSNHVTQCIDRAGNAFNAPAKKSVDALPWLLHSLVVSEYKLRSIEKTFLNERLANFVSVYLDPTTGDLKPGLHYAELRDAVYYDRSAYAIALIARMSVCAEQLGLDFPFNVETYRRILLDTYWQGDYFKADRKNSAYSSECALMPFFLNIIDDAEKLKRTVAYVRREGYQKLSPLEYCKDWRGFRFRLGMGPWIMPNYTGTTIWTWHATFYLHLLDRYDLPEYAEEYHKFARLIERHGTYPELLNPDGTWYKAPFYKSDPGMVWAALLLELPAPAVSSSDRN